MTWQLWVVVAWLFLGMVAELLAAEKTKRTATMQALAVVITSALIALILWGSHA